MCNPPHTTTPVAAFCLRGQAAFRCFICTILLGLLSGPVAGQNVISRNVVLHGVLDISPVSGIFPPGDYARMLVMETDVPGTTYGIMSRTSLTEDYLWGTYGANSFGPPQEPSLTQHRINAGQGFRYSNNGTGLGMSESIPVRFTTTDGTTSDEYTLVINIISQVGAPVITQQPSPLQAVEPGQSTTIGVVATGDNPLSYQWYRGFPPSTSDPVLGATAANFVTPVITEVGQYHYWVQVRNNIATVNSLGVTLNVSNPPTADAGGPYSVGELQTIKLSGLGSSDPDQPSTSLAYTWDFDGNSIYGLNTLYGQESGATPDFTAVDLEGPGTHSIGVRVSDNTDIIRFDTASMTVFNVPPRATFTTNGTGGVISFTGVMDSPQDLAAGVLYSYDFDADGIYEILNTTSTSAIIPPLYMPNYLAGHPVRGRTLDRDGGVHVYGATVQGRLIVVTTLADENNGAVGYEIGATPTSLREAIALANSDPGMDLIMLDAPLLSTPGTTVPLGSEVTVSSPILLTRLATGNSYSIAGNGGANRAFRVTTGGNLTLDRLTVRDFNHTASNAQGGAIYNEGMLTLRRCTLRDNRAVSSNLIGSAQGGGIYSNGGVLTLENSTLAGNQLQSGVPSLQYGGAIYARGTSVNLTHCTLTANSAILGRGLLLHSDGVAVSSANITNCIIGGSDAATTDFQAMTSNGASLPYSTGSHNLIRVASGFGGGFSTADPLMATIADNGGGSPTVLPQRGSPAINGGTYLPEFAIDQRGIARPQAREVDIGAVEFDAFVESLVVSTTVDEEDGTSDGTVGTGTSLREALIRAHATPGADTVTFAPGMAGQTVVLSQGWAHSADEYALRITSQITVQGPSTGPGVVLQVASGVTKRHFAIGFSGNLTLVNLTLTNGSVTGAGGAVLNAGALAVQGCTFSANQAAGEGGAISSSAGSATLLVENSTFAGNQAGSFGSAIATGAISSTFRHLTLSGNSGGSGVLWLNQQVVSMRNCLVLGNTNDSIAVVSPGAFAGDSSNNCMGSGSLAGIVNGSNGNLTGFSVADVGLGTLTDNGGPTPTMALSVGSLLINRAVTIAGLASDQRGLARVAGNAPDIGAFEVASGDDDPDGDSLNNMAEWQSGTDPQSIDVDEDGFNDPTELLAGTNPNSDGSFPPSTHFSRVLGFGAAEGLDLKGSFPYAFNVGTNGAAGQIGDANFTADSASGILLLSSNQIASWTTRDFGPTVEENRLESVYQSIRWGSSVYLVLNNLVPLKKYKLQLLVAESSDYNRKFDVVVEGALVANDFHPSAVQGIPLSSKAAAAIVHEFTATDGNCEVILAGGSVADPLADVHPILNGVTLEEIPTAAPAPVLSTGGTYAEGHQVAITNLAQGGVIRYTLDGSTPTASNGRIYTGPITLRNSATVKAVALGGGWLPSPVASASYHILTPLVQWRALHGLPPDGSGDLGNPSGDGIANLLKYAFNMAPVAGDLLLPRAGVLPVDGNAGLPRIWRGTDGKLNFQFVRRKAGTNAGLGYLVQTSEDLSNWKTLPYHASHGLVVASINADWERVTMMDPVVSDSRFGRVRVARFSEYTNDFSAGVGDAILRGNAIWSSNAIQLTSPLVSQVGSVVIGAFPAGPDIQGFEASFTLNIGPTGQSNPADGVSFAAGDLGATAFGESGPSTANHLSVGFDTYPNAGVGAGIGIHLRSNGVLLASNPTNPFTNGQDVPVEVIVDPVDGVTVYFNGSIVFDKVAAPALAFPVDGKFGFGGRTGGAVERAMVDNVRILPR